MTPPTPDIKAILRGDRGAVAAALNLIEESEARRDSARDLLAAMPPPPPSSRSIGVTGPPGVGKSSLIAALIPGWRRNERSVAVLAVDPSSPRSGGALLGDRLRMSDAAGDDDGVFIRSLAGRGELGGLAAAVFPMTRLLLGVFDIVVVETVGVGQAEADVAQLADVTSVVLQPGSGDAIQFLKAGLIELPQLVVINKADADRHEQATHLAHNLTAQPGWHCPVVVVSARERRGIESLAEALDAARTTDQLERRRRHQAAAWGIKRIQLEFGRFGVDLLGGPETLAARWLADQGSPFDLLEILRKELLERWQAC